MLLLQTDGLSLYALNTMTTYRVPVTWSGPNAWPTVIILGMLMPSVFISPLLTGAVGWTPVTVHDGLIEVSGGFGSASREPSAPRAVTVEDLEEWLFHALGYASASWPDSPNDQKLSGYRYIANSRAPVGSVVSAVPMPYIEIHSLRWENNPESWVKKLLLDHTPLDYAETHASTSFMVGNALLFQQNTTFSSDPSDDTQPYTGTWKVGVLASRSLGNATCESAARVRWDYPAELTFVPGRWDNCYVAGEVTITTGVRTWDEGIYVTSRTVEAKSDSHGMAKVRADKWTKPAIQMTSSMLQYLPTVRMDQDGERTKNLTEYVELLLRDSYIAMRSTFRVYTPDTINLKCLSPTLHLRASVSHIRVFLWLALILLLPASSLVVGWLERCSKGRNLVIDTPLALLLTDSRNVLVHDTHGISNLSYVTKEDSRNLGKVRIGLVKIGDCKEAFGLTLTSARDGSESGVGADGSQTWENQLREKSGHSE